MTHPPMSAGQRRLAAIMVTDMIGYAALTQIYEARALRLLETHRRLLRPMSHALSVNTQLPRK